MKNPLKRLSYWFQTLLYSGIFLGVLILVFILANPFNRIYDFSVEKKYSFTSETKDLFREVKSKKIDLIGFFKDDDPMVREIESLFSSFKNYLPKLSFKNYDPEKELDAAKKYGIHGYGILMVEMDGRRMTFLDFDEDGMREALEKIRVKKRPVIFFTDGHREAQLTDRGNLGYAFLKDFLINHGYVVKQNFIDSRQFLEADVVVVSYPKSDFSAYELDRLREHLDGGSAIFMVDPEEESVYPEFQKFLTEYGVKLGDNVVLDRTSRMYGADDLIPVVTDFTNHEIVRGFELPLFFPLVRSIHMTEPIFGGKWDMDYLIFSGKDSWGETDYLSLERGDYSFDKLQDVKGPLALALALQREASPKNRLLVFGDSDFINNTNFNTGGNRQTFLNSVAWVLKEKMYFKDKGPAPESEPWVVPKGKRIQLFLSIIVAPSVCCFLILGLFLLLRRFSA